jgi:hypothetical protein
MKKIYSLGLVIFLCSSGSLQSQANLIANYTFNGGSAADNSGNGNTGTFYGAAANVDTLTIGYNTNDYFSVPGAVLNGRTQFSIMLKIKFNSFNTSGQYPTNTIFSADNSSATGIFAFSYQKDINTWRVGNGVTAFDFVDNTIIANKWYCVTLTKDNSNNLKLYIDGTQHATVNTYTTPVNVTSFLLGQETDCFAGCFAANQSGNAKFDDVRFYDAPATLAQIGSTCYALVGVKEFPKFQMEVYPNPAASVLKIKNANKLANFSLTVSSVDGKQLIENDYKSETDIDLNISDLKPGVYFLTMTQGSEKSVMKFIRE